MNRGAGLQSMGHKESDMTGVTQHAHIRIKLHIFKRLIGNEVPV